MIIFDLTLLGAWPQRQEVSSWLEALALEEELRGRGCFTLLVHPDDFQKIKSKTDKYYVLDANGQPATYEAAFPKETAAIEKMFVEMVNPRLPQVYYVQNPRLSPAMEQAWAMARSKWNKIKE